MQPRLINKKTTESHGVLHRCGQVGEIGILFFSLLENYDSNLKFYSPRGGTQHD